MEQTFIVRDLNNIIDLYAKDIQIKDREIHSIETYIDPVKGSVVFRIFSVEKA